MGTVNRCPSIILHGTKKSIQKGVRNEKNTTVTNKEYGLNTQTHVSNHSDSTKNGNMISTGHGSPPYPSAFSASWLTFFFWPLSGKDETFTSPNFCVNLLISHCHVSSWSWIDFLHTVGETENSHGTTGECSPHPETKEVYQAGLICHDEIFSQPTLNIRFLTCTILARSMNPNLTILHRQLW